MYWLNTNIFHTRIAPTICEAIVGVVPLGQLVKDGVAARGGELENPAIFLGRVLNNLPNWERRKSWELALAILRWLQENEHNLD